MDYTRTHWVDDAEPNINAANLNNIEEGIVAAQAAIQAIIDAGPGGGGPGVVSHGQLDGLDEDDHPQYLTTGRGDSRYVQPSDLPSLDGYVQDDDPRLSDARPPTEHRHAWSDLDDVLPIPATPEDIGAQPAGDYAAADHDHDGVYVKPDDLPDPPDLSGYVQDDDPRLSDAREPTEHDHPEYLTADDVPEFPEFPDLSEFVRSDDARLSDARPPTEHDHPEYQPAGDYLTRDEIPEIPDLSDVVLTDDPRLSDARPPTAHSHPEYLTAEDVPEFPDLSDVIREGDERLSDPRQPTSHRHPWTDLDDAPVIPSEPADIGAQPAGDYLTASDLPEPPDLSDVVREGDPRLSDERDPTEHQHNYSDISDPPAIPASPADIGAQPAGDYLTADDLPDPPDLSDVVRDDDPRLSDAREPTDHDHPEYQPAGDYLTPEDLPPAPDLSGLVRDDDPRLSDSRPPTEHDHDDRYIRTVNGNGPDETGNVTVEGGGGGGGTDDHRALSYRSVPDAHPILAITGLTDALESKQPVGDYLTSEDLPDVSDVVREGDPRLSDARDPNQHRHAWADLDDTPAIPSAPEDIGAQPAGDYLTPGDLPEAPDLSDVVRTDDPRLADAREPVDHRHDYSDLDGTPAIPAAPEDIGAQPAGDYLTAADLPEVPDVSDVIREGDARLSDPRDPTEHRHAWGDLDDAPSIPTVPGDIGAQPAGDYATRDEIPEVPPAPDLTGYVTTDDSRLSDARTPTAHRHPWGDLDDVPEIPSEPEDIGAQPAGDYLTPEDLPEPPDLSGLVRTDDPRMSDARPPTAHSHPEYLTAEDVPEFPDLSAFVETDDPRLSDARTPLDHGHDMEDVGGLSAALADLQPRGEYLTAEDLPEPPDVSDVIREGDPRLSDARQPTDHRHSWSDLDDTPAIPASPGDIGAQPAGDYLTPGDLPEPPDLSDVVRDDDERLSDARPPTSHRHDYADLDGTPVIPSQPGDIGAQPAGDYASAGHHHDGTYQPVGDYLTADDLPAPPDLSDVVRDDDPRLSDARTPTAHDHDDRYYTESEVDTALAGKANTSHQHGISEVSGLQSALDGKAATGHNHDSRYYTESEVDTALSGKADATHQHPISGVTGLQSALDDKAEADHGHTLDAVTDTTSRVAMTPAERTKLGGVATNATANATDAQLRARSSHTGTQAISTVNGLQSALDGKVDDDDPRLSDARDPVEHDHPIADVTGLQSALNGKAATLHTHTAAQISDATTTGRAVMQASSAAAARSAIGAGTSNLSIGTGAASAAAGNHTHDEYAPATQDLKVRNGYLTYALTGSDAGKVVTLAASSAITATVPASVFTAGQRVDVLQRGAAAVTLLGGSGMTLHGTPSLVTRAQWSAISVLFLSATEAVVIGDLAEPSGTGGVGGRGTMTQ